MNAPKQVLSFVQTHPLIDDGRKIQEIDVGKDGPHHGSKDSQVPKEDGPHHGLKINKSQKRTDPTMG